MINTLWALLMIVVAVTLLVAVRRDTRLGSSKDGAAFQCRLYDLTDARIPVIISGVGTIEGHRICVGTGKIRHRNIVTLRLVARSPEPPKGTALFLCDRDGTPMAVAVAAGSPAANRLDAMLP
jgi:hypothetical protein